MKRLALLLLMAACADSNAWRGSMETLPNGAVRVTNPAEGVWSEDTRWRLVPRLTIGSAEGDEATVFGAISGVEAGDDGRIYVLDRQANELRIFSEDGTHLRSAGRQGGGPGEYANANGLRWLAADTLVIVDQRGNRYSVLDRNGEFVRSVPRNLGFFGWILDGALVDGSLYEVSSVGSGDQSRPVLLGTRVAGGSATLVSEPGAPVSLEHPVDTIPLPQTAGPAFESFSVRTERGGMVMGVPFAPRAFHHIDPYGGVWHGHGSAIHLVRTTMSGDTTMEVLVDAAAAPVDVSELKEWRASDGVVRFREMGGDLDESRIPATKPLLDGVYSDDEGFLWISRPSEPGRMVFAIVNPEGRYMGDVAIEGVQRDSYIPPAIRNGRLYVVGRDELDVQRVYVFDIEGR